METEVRNVHPREGYDRWAETYDRTANPLVALDERVTFGHLRPARGERVLDAGCGTGRHLGRLLDAGCTVTGIDFSEGMLEVARRRHPDADLRTVDLEGPLPFETQTFDVVLFALVAEHITRLSELLSQMHRVLKTGGRFVLSVYDPSLAAAGKEANFTVDGVEYRLGAHGYTRDDYARTIEGAGLALVDTTVYDVDEDLVRACPPAARYLGGPMLLVFDAKRTT